MRNFVLALKHKLDVHFRYDPFKHKKIKMIHQNDNHLDGSERSMISIIKSNASMIDIEKKPSQLVALEEFAVGTGISDLTIFTVDRKLMESRKNRNVAPVTSKVNIQLLLTLLEKGSLTIEELVNNSYGRGRQTVQKSLELLIQSGLVVRRGDKYVADYSIKDSVTDGIIAIEAKVKDWRSGIRQAMRYKEYADYSYLAIYEDNIASCLKNIEVFKTLGIGLIGVSDGGIEVHLKARASDVATAANKLLAYERFISVVDERYESYVPRNNFGTNNA